MALNRYRLISVYIYIVEYKNKNIIYNITKINTYKYKDIERLIDIYIEEYIEIEIQTGLYE